MESEKLSALLHILTDNEAGRGPECPDNNLLAAFLDGQLPATEHEQITLHMADCDFCLSQTGLMMRLRASSTETAPGEFVVARAKRMGRQSNRPALGKAVRWASAAVIVLALLLMVRLDPPGPKGFDTSAGSSAYPASEPLDSGQIRNFSPAKLELRVLSPVDGATLDPGRLEFAWTGVPGSLYYDVRIVSDGGNLLWQTQVEDNRLELPGSLQLEPDTDYFFRVDAHLASAKDISSQHILFSIRERH